MPEVALTFDQKPRVASTLFKALLLPRKGFNAAAGMPDIKASWNNVRIDSAELNAYLSLLDLPLLGSLPILYPHVIAGRMHMHMLMHKAFPIRLLGAIHMKNRIIQHRPITGNMALDIHSQIGASRLVEKGMEFDLTTRFTSQGELLWEETSIYFKAGYYGGKKNPSAEKSFELSSLDAPEGFAKWPVPLDRGKKYARISGDYNPIHMSKMMAKIFGFKRDISHGFSVLAEAIHHSGLVTKADQKIQVDAIFKGPCYLGSELQIRQNKAQDASRFDVYCGENPKPSFCVAVLSL